MLVPPVVVELAEGDVLLVTVDEFVCDFTWFPKNVKNKIKWEILKKLTNFNFIFKSFERKKKQMMKLSDQFLKSYHDTFQLKRLLL